MILGFEIFFNSSKMVIDGQNYASIPWSQSFDPQSQDSDPWFHIPHYVPEMGYENSLKRISHSK